MTNDRGEGSSSAGSRSKVARLLREYGMRSFGDELVDRWTGATGEREGLRSLADRFNRRLLRERMFDAGLSPVDGEVDNLYRLLVNKEASSGMRRQVRSRLSRAGIDLDGLVDDFVSYQAIRTYLKSYRGVDPPSSDDDGESRVETERASVNRLRGRVQSVTEDKIEALTGSGGLHVADPQVTVDVSVYCEGCETRYDVDALFESGGCDCEA
jgi:hypothetical protein